MIDFHWGIDQKLPFGTLLVKSIRAMPEGWDQSVQRLHGFGYFDNGFNARAWRS